jgi:hypothetical protein
MNLKRRLNGFVAGLIFFVAWIALISDKISTIILNEESVALCHIRFSPTVTRARKNPIATNFPTPQRFLCYLAPPKICSTPIHLI